MGYRSTYSPGDWKTLCYLCGRIFKASQLRRHWQGYYVCEGDWEVRQPQDFVRGVADIQAPPWTQPEPADTFIPVCTPNGSSSIADYAIADCAVCDYKSPLFDPTLSP